MTRLPRKVTVESGAVKEIGRLSPTSLDLTLNLIPLHRASAVLAESDLPLQVHDLVEVYNQNGSAGIYRVASITKTKRRERKVSLNHGLDILSDSCFATIETFSGTVAGFLARIIAAQTQTANGTPYWTLGTVDDTNPWNKDIQYDNLMECLTEIARTEEDYMFTFDMSGFPWVLNFVARDSTVLSEFRLRHNTESCQITLDDGDLCTRLHLSVTEETSSTVGSQTVVTTQEGYYTYDDTAAQAIYGIVAKTAGVYRKDVPTAAALQAWVDAYFSRHHAPAVQISIDGEELIRHTGCTIDEVHLGRICRVALPDYGETYNERVVSVQYPDVLRQPRRVKVSLANKRETAEGTFAQIRENTRRAGGAARKAQATAENNEVELIRQHADIEKYGGWLRLWASEEEWDEIGERYVATGATQLSIESDAITGLAAGAGVQLDEVGRPVVDAQGNPVFIEDSAVPFSVGTYFAKGTYVRHEGTVYQLTAAHNPGTTWENTSKKAVPDSVYSKAIQNADAISLEVTNRRNGDSTLQGLIQVEADKITQIVRAVGDDGQVTAASIVAAINNGGSSVVISADHVDLQGYVTATELATMDLYVASVHADAVDVGGECTIDNEGYIDCSGLTVAGTDFDDIVGGIADVQISGPSNNTYKLQLKRYGDTSWTDAGTFSRATTLAGTWSGGILDVEASPQGEHYYQYLSKGSTTWNGNTASIPIQHCTSPTGVFSDTGYTIQVDASNVVSSAVSAANAAVTLTKTWGTGSNAGRLSVTNSANSRVATVELSAGTVTWSGTQATIPVLDGSAQVTSFSLNVSGKLETRTVTPTASQQVITPSSGKIGMSQVTVEAAPATIVTVSSIAGGAAYGSAYDSYEGHWVGYIPITVTLSDGTTDSQNIQVNVQQPINEGVTQGWNQARGKVSLPAAGTNTSFDVTVPGATWNTSETKAFAVSVSGGYAYVNDGTNNVARSSYISKTVPSTVASIGTNRGSRTNAGSISKSALVANTYLGFSIRAAGVTTEYYITVNA